MGGREEERVREAHETLCLKASCSPSSWRLFKKIGQRNETRENRGPGRFAASLRTPFAPSATSLSTRATRVDLLSPRSLLGVVIISPGRGGEEEAQRGVRNTRTHPQGRREEEAREILDPTIVVSRRPSCLPPFRRRTPTETMSHDLYASGERFLNLPRFGVS